MFYLIWCHRQIEGYHLEHLISFSLIDANEKNLKRFYNTTHWPLASLSSMSKLTPYLNDLFLLKLEACFSITFIDISLSENNKFRWDLISSTILWLSSLSTYSHSFLQHISAGNTLYGASTTNSRSSFTWQFLETWIHSSSAFAPFCGDKSLSYPLFEVNAMFSLDLYLTHFYFPASIMSFRNLLRCTCFAYVWYV